MKKILIALVVLFLGFANIVYAHTVVTDRNITILMHIDPNDTPVAGEGSTIHFGVTDATNNFRSSNCNCVVTISENGKNVLEKPVLNFKNGDTLYNAYLPYVFPEIGVYTIRLSGAPKNKYLFQPFSSSFDIRIDTEASKPVVSSIVPANIILAIIVTLVASAVLLLVHQVLQSNKKR